MNLHIALKSLGLGLRVPFNPAICCQGKIGRTELLRLPPVDNSGRLLTRGALPSPFSTVALLLCGLALLAYAQSYTGGTSQSNQIGPNAFVSSPKGELYVLLNDQLYHNTRDSGDAWAPLASDAKAVALDPQNETVLYAIDTQNHVLKSLDAGKQWLTLNIGFPNVRLSTIYVNPKDSQEVLLGAANGLFRTTDAGFSWHPTSFVLPVNQIVLDPRAASRRYVLSAGSIFVSSDGGDSWKKSETGLPVEIIRGVGRTATKVPARVSLLVSVDWDKPFLIAATYGKGIVRSDDGGLSWSPAGTGLDSSETFITSAVGRQRVVLSSSDHLYRSSDGTRWNRIAVKGGRNVPVNFLGVIEHPKRDGLLVQFRFPQDGAITNVGALTRVGYLDASDVLVGLNYGVLQHSEIDSVWAGATNGEPTLFAVAADLFEIDQVERWSRPTFSFVSTDNGYSWQSLGRSPCGTSVTRPQGTPNELWVYGSGNCISRSRNGGLDWELVPGLAFPSSNAGITAFQFDPTNHDLAYYSSGVNERHLYRYQYNSEVRQGQAVDLKTIAAGVLVDERNHSHLFTDTARLSTDGGWTWKDKSSLLAKSCKCDIGVYYIGPAKLLSYRSDELRVLIDYKGDPFNSYPGDIAVLRSTDLGDTWNTVAKLAIHKLLAGPFVNPDDAMNVFVVAESAPKGTPGAFGTSYRPDAVEVLETKDGGASWTEVYRRALTGQLQAGNLVRSVAQLSRPGGRSIFLGTSEGLLRSDDEGHTWVRLGGIR